MENNKDNCETLVLGPVADADQEVKSKEKFGGFSVLDGIFPSLDYDSDAGDIPSDKALIGADDLFWIIISILTHLVDIVADLNLARHYWQAEQYAWFTWTSIFLFIPSFINIIISNQMYRNDKQNDPEYSKGKTFASRIAQTIVLWPLILLFQLAPVLRYIDTFIYAVKSYRSRKKGDQIKQKRYYLKMLKEEQDISLLRVLECFLEAAPHQILQLTIILIDYHDDFNLSFGGIHQFISIISSFIGMGWAMSSYHRSIRKAQWDKENLSAVGNWLQFLWHFFLTISRVTAITAAAAILPIYTGIVATIHWFLMTIWIVMAPSGMLQFCRDNAKPLHARPNLHERLKAYLLGTIFGIVYIFTYLKTSEGPTYWRHMFYYFICGIENVIAACIWFFMKPPAINALWYSSVITSLCIVPFALGIIVMIIFYKFFHPTMKNTCNHTSGMSNNAA